MVILRECYIAANFIMYLIKWAVTLKLIFLSIDSEWNSWIIRKVGLGR